MIGKSVKVINKYSWYYGKSGEIISCEDRDHGMGVSSKVLIVKINEINQPMFYDSEISVIE